MVLTIMLAAVTAAAVTVVDADRVERLLDEQFLDANGVFLSSNDARPDYENSSMVHGAHLAAMVAKHRATGDPSALRQASRSAQAIFRIYALSAPGGEGFYCKPWGWQYQDQTSSDQYIYAMTGLDDYYPYATAAERAQIADLIPKMTRWWIAHGYKWHYFKNPPFVWQRCRFISFMALAAMTMIAERSPEAREWTLAQVPQLLKRVVDGKHFTSIEDPFEVFPADFRRQMATTVDVRGKTVRRLRAEPMAEWLWAYWNLENLKRDSGR